MQCCPAQEAAKSGNAAKKSNALLVVSPDVSVFLLKCSAVSMLKCVIQGQLTYICKCILAWSGVLPSTLSKSDESTSRREYNNEPSLQQNML